eukprot:5967943-Prorocentrum_lima.AAC.1
MPSPPGTARNPATTPSGGGRGSGGGGSGQGGGKRAASGAPGKGGWQCPVCKFPNYVTRTVCLRCAGPCPEPKAAAARASSRSSVAKRPSGAVMQPPPPPSGFGSLPQPGQPASSGG